MPDEGRDTAWTDMFSVQTPFRDERTSLFRPRLTFLETDLASVTTLLRPAHAQHTTLEEPSCAVEHKISQLNTRYHKTNPVDTGSVSSPGLQQATWSRRNTTSGYFSFLKNNAHNHNFVVDVSMVTACS